MRLRTLRVKRGSHTLEYAQIIEDFVEDGKKNTRLVKHLGRIRSQEDVERYRRMFALEKRKGEVEKADLKKIDVLPHLDFGMIYATGFIAHDLNPVFDILENHRDIIFLSAVSRMIHPDSDISLMRFLDRSYYPEIKELKKDQIYRALDLLISKKEEIEIAIVNALKPDLRRVYYDLTSTYFEGKEKNDLVMFGYSRDKKRGKKQIVVGLTMADGIPIHHEVWKGNTIDPETLPSTLKDMRNKFHVGRVIFIGDRAFGRKPSLKILDRSEYITAVYRWDQPYRDVMMNQQFSEGDRIADLDIYAREVQLEWNLKDMGKREVRRSRRRRAIVVWNPERQRSDMDEIEDKISTVKAAMSSGESGKALADALGELRSFTKSGGTQLNIERIEMMKKLAGRYMVVTDTDLPLNEVVKSYRDLWKIERSFRTIKSFIEIRPVNHRRDDRIEAHVFLCVLSLLISRLFEKAVNGEMTISKISEILSELEAIPIRTEEGKIILSTRSDEARKLLERMKIPYPNRVLESVLT